MQVRVLLGVPLHSQIRLPLPGAEHRRRRLPREQVGGHEVVLRLGTESTGEILLVHQSGLDREVALKRPHSANLTGEQVEAFERENLEALRK